MAGPWHTRALSLCLPLASLWFAPAAAAEDAPAAPQRGASPSVSNSAPPWYSHLRLGAEWGNDQLYGSDGDDLGFTQDITLEAHILDATNDASLSVRQRLMVERGGVRRTDEVTCEFGWLREHAAGPFVWTFGPSAALVLSGNYGGSELQNYWHELLDNGYTFDEGLPNRYQPHRTGLVLGGHGGPSWLALPWLRLLVGVELAGALGGTGQSRIALYDAVEFESGGARFRLALTGGVDYERSWTSDPTLALPGGYDTSGIYRSTHLRMAARGPQWEVGLRAETNVGGSEAHMGMAYVLLGGGEGFRHEHALR